MQLHTNKRKHYLILTLMFSVIIITSIALIIQFISSAVESVEINSAVENPNNL